MGIHGFAVFCGFFDFFGDFLIIFVFENAFDDNTETGDDEEDGEDDFPGDIVVENILSGEEENDTGGEEAEAG